MALSAAEARLQQRKGLVPAPGPALPAQEPGRVLPQSEHGHCRRRGGLRGPRGGKPRRAIPAMSGGQLSFLGKREVAAGS